MYFVKEEAPITIGFLASRDLWYDIKGYDGDVQAFLREAVREYNNKEYYLKDLLSYNKPEYYKQSSGVLDRNYPYERSTLINTLSYFITNYPIDFNPYTCSSDPNYQRFMSIVSEWQNTGYIVINPNLEEDSNYLNYIERPVNEFIITDPDHKIEVATTYFGPDRADDIKNDHTLIGPNFDMVGGRLELISSTASCDNLNIFVSEPYSDTYTYYSNMPIYNVPEINTKKQLYLHVGDGASDDISGYQLTARIASTQGFIPSETGESGNIDHGITITPSILPLTYQNLNGENLYHFPLCGVYSSYNSLFTSSTGSHLYPIQFKMISKQMDLWKIKYE